ncbi:imidazolonepropionase [Bacillus sp. FSL W7-1360]
MTYRYIKGANQVITMAGASDTPKVGTEMSEIDVRTDANVLLRDDEIIGVDTHEALLAAFPEEVASAEVIDATGKVVTPGFVEPHTHLVYAGSREQEFAMRLQGESYMAIMNAGGGIHATTRATRAASFEELYSQSKRRLNQFMQYGVTTVEAKSGYGLDWEVEKRQLEVAHALNRDHPLDIVHTFMGAHAVPAEYKGNEDAFVDIVCEKMIPEVARLGLATFNDVFCERGVFTPAQAERVLKVGQAHGLKAKIHADEIEPYEGAELAAQVGAVSADHLLRISDAGIQAMAEKKVVGVLLPGTAFFLMTDAADGRKMVDAGVPVALSTDCNPGSSPTVSTGLILSLACLNMGMTPAEALTAVTINAAHAIDQATRVGSIEVGKQADIVVHDIPDYRQLVYHYGMNHTDTVMKAGKVVYQRGGCA